MRFMDTFIKQLKYLSASDLHLMKDLIDHQLTWTEEEGCSPYCSQGSLPIDEEPCEACRRKEE